VLSTHVGQLKGTQLLPQQLIEFVFSTSNECSPQVVDWVVPIGRYLGKIITYPAGKYSSYPFDFLTFQTTLYLSYLAGIHRRFTFHFKTCVCFKAGEKEDL
jgi:hypothetical protein